MNDSISKVKKILTSEYTNDGFTNLIREFFPTVILIAPDRFNKEYTNYSSHIEGYIHVGNVVYSGGQKLLILAVQLKNEKYVETSRSTQRNYAKKLIESGNADAAIIAFYTLGDSKWRISFVRLDYDVLIENGRMNTVETLTPAKRYSYLVGKDEPCHTAISRFQRYIIGDSNSESPTIDVLEEIFSVGSVTDDFFNLYCEKFQQLREALENNPDFVDEAKQHNFTSEQFAKKLMGQIVFLYFLQKKGWLGVGTWSSTITRRQYNNVFYVSGAKGRLIKEYLPLIYIQTDEDVFTLKRSMLEQIPDDVEELIANNLSGQRSWGSGSKKFMRTLFDYAQKKGANFFDDYLEPLFYNTLNKNRGENGYDPKLHCRIPFLSGGLFEPIDGYDWKHNDFAIPNDIFSNIITKGEMDADGILDIFDRFNFTMSEDEPLEREVAIDPEMLGKVFENLLEIKDRKSKGAFYTPREIVHYMCQESLISYLVNETGISDTDIRDFILMGDFMKDEDTSRDKRRGNENMFISDKIFKIDENGRVIVNRLRDLDDALASIRVVDPAVGSGAFPLGMLNEIVRARQNISAYMAINLNAYDIRIMYNNDRSPYSLKLHTIKNCIFASDIEPSAVDIAQLRLWLSLVIDDEINPDAQSLIDGHRNPIPLPNLECNILCGNSLIDEFEGIELINHSDLIVANSKYQSDIFQKNYNTILPLLIKAQDELFSCDDTNKKQEIKERIEKIKDELVASQIGNCNDLIWDKYQIARKQASRPFVLWQIDFARVFMEKGGFDIVIGNPPYLHEIDYKDIFDVVSKTRFGKDYSEGKMNYWYYFFHKGIDILRNNGLLSFIAPNYFVAGSGASKLNNRIVNSLTIRRYVDFNKTKVFKTADVQCMILMVENEIPFNHRPFNAYMFKRAVDREELPRIMTHINSANEVSRYVVEDQKSIMSSNNKINFENEKYSTILNKIERMKSNNKLFKATQGIVENPNSLNKKNIAALGKSGVDITCFHPGEPVFVIPRGLLDSLGLNTEERTFLREYHEPNEIYRYYCNDSFNNYILYLTRDTVDDIEQYPNLFSHLIRYRAFMEQRRETQSGTIEWFHLHWPRKESLFTGEKVVYPQMCKIPTFAYSKSAYFINMSANLVYSTSSIDLKVLTCVLNSRLAHFWLLHRAKNRGVGLDIAVSVIDNFPINEDILNNQSLKEYADEIIQLAQQNEDITKIEKNIDELVFSLYSITTKEKEIIQKYIDERVQN